MAKFKAEVKNIEWYRQNVPCLTACPVHTDSGKYVQLIAEKEFKKAYLVARSPNPIASICARVCAAPCEDACRRSKIDEAVTIRRLKRFVCEKYGSESALPDTINELFEGGPDCGGDRPWHLPNLVKTGKKIQEIKVAVVGSGPAGLACAHDLAILGYKVTVFEASSTMGGMMRLGIPEYRLPRGVIKKEAQTIMNLGVDIKLNTRLGNGFGIRELKDLGYQAIFLGVGTMAGITLKLPGSDLDGIVSAVDFLLNVNQGYKIDLGKNILVIGGGSVALDAARTAIRQFHQPVDEIEKTVKAGEMHVAIDVARSLRRIGAEVTIASLESAEEMPASKTVQGIEEMAEAEEEGIHFIHSAGPQRFLGENNKLTGIEFLKVKRVFDDEGKFNPEFEKGTEHVLNADSVILAVGQKPDTSFIREDDGIETTPYGTIKIDAKTLSTTAPGIYAGGDVAFGPRILIEAAANGKKAAQSINNFLNNVNHTTRLKINIEKIPISEYKMPSSYELIKRSSAPTVPTERRTGITEVELSYDEEEAIRQAERCLQCHVETIYDSELCILCGRCVDVCPEDCLKLVPLDQVDIKQIGEVMKNQGLDENEPLSVMLKDHDRCIRCGLCALRCPTEAMTMERFSFDEMIIGA